MDLDELIEALEAEPEKAAELLSVLLRASAREIEPVRREGSGQSDAS